MPLRHEGKECDSSPMKGECESGEDMLSEACNNNQKTFNDYPSLEALIADLPLKRGCP